MQDRTASPKLFAGAPPELKVNSRDPRIDACRGIALWCIFLDHVPNNIGSWLTLRNYGFSDAAEVFMFVSGVTCALAYGKVRSCEGWTSVIRRTLRRSWDIYVAFLLLTLACAILVHLAGGDRLADESNTRILLDQPGSALAHAAILQYRPVNTDVLPNFVLLHLFFAPLLWLLLRMPNVTLGASLALYALVQMFGWSMPAWPSGHWAFNPLAWQLLAVLGAWMIIEGERVRPWLTSRTVLVPAALYLIFSLVIALSWRIKPLEALIPQGLTKLAYPLDKSNLDPLRLLHFLALAVVAVWFAPPNRQALTSAVMRGAILCGKHSLPIFCLGVLLTLASLLALLDISEGLAMQITLSVGGVLMMIVAATLLNLVKITPRLQPTVALAAGVRVPPAAWGTVGWRPLEAFRRGLRELGWAGGRNPVINCWFVDRQSHRVYQVFGLADGLVRPKADVIAASPKPAARNATATIPSAEYGF
ncbi:MULTISPECIES: OpgC domain-containing protein [Bradyrhizobium]|uniref:OpgC domain-containing protein n=1 Tax=Bradyrhizobium TaxID=374 RepID=UPI0012609BAD|nr:MULTISPECIES: OpgC domain-containing protein [Bradyrhizobium]MBR1329014.1 OpgC domain-containing protein [Bradyrhizobium ottawaense]BBO14596.1 membrane protein [Bradyrhizobium sp. TM102]